jgi:outer membrane protein TolC
LGRRPDLHAAEERLRAADERLYAARAALYPRLSFAGSVGRTSNDVDDLVDPDFSIWSVAGNLVQPVFQGGRLRAGVDLADARVAESLSLLEAAQLTAFEEVESALAADGLLARQEERQSRATEEADAAADMAEERYAAGLTEFLTVLEAQRRAFETETQLLEVRRRRLENRIDLHLALGGGLGDPEPTP